MIFARVPSHSSTAGPRIMRWSQVLLFMIGVIALGYVGFTVMEAKFYQASATRSLETQGFGPIHQGNATGANSNVQIGDALGRIAIPRIGLSVVVLQGTGARVLRLGAGHVEDTPLPGEPGNSGIAGHRDTFFRGLKDVRTDDELELQTASGVTHYRVDSVRVVQPHDTSVLWTSSGDSSLTLVTCYPFYLVGPAPKRFVVHARKLP